MLNLERPRGVPIAVDIDRRARRATELHDAAFCAASRDSLLPASIFADDRNSPITGELDARDVGHIAVSRVGESELLAES